MDPKQFKEIFKEAIQAVNRSLGAESSAKQTMAALNVGRTNKPRKIKKNDNKQASIAIALQQAQEQAQEQEQDQEQQQAVKQKKIDDWENRKLKRLPLPQNSSYKSVYTRAKLQNLLRSEEQLLLWDKCLGRNVNNIENSRDRIECITDKAWDIIKANERFFTDGISLDHLPAGFFLYTRKYENNKTTLDYDEKLLSTTDDYPLRVKLNPTAHKIDNREFPDRGKFLFQEQYQQLIKSSDRDASLRIHKSHLVFNYPVPEQYQALIKSLDGHDLHEVKAMQDLTKEDPGVFLLHVHTLNDLKNSGRYSESMNIINKIKLHWTNLFIQEEIYQDLHDFIKAIEGIIAFSDAEFSWWKTLAEQHVRKENNDSLFSTVKMAEFFFHELKRIDPDIELPHSCELNKVQHMGITLERALCILNNSINPAEQIKTLHELNLGVEGAAYYFMSNGFVRATPAMKLYPASEDENNKKEFPKTFKLYCDQKDRRISPIKPDTLLYTSDNCPLVDTAVIDGEILPVYKINFMAFGGYGDLFVAAVRHKIVSAGHKGEARRINGIENITYYDYPGEYDEVLYGQGQYEYKYDAPNGERFTGCSRPPPEGIPYKITYNFSHFVSGKDLGKESAYLSLDNEKLDQVLISKFELRSSLTQTDFFEILNNAKTISCIKLLILRYLGQQPWIAGDDSLEYYHQQIASIRNQPKFNGGFNAGLMVLAAYLSSGKRGALLDQRKALDQMLDSLAQECKGDSYKNRNFFDIMIFILKYQSSPVRPTILEAHAIYKLIYPSDEIYPSNEAPVEDVLGSGATIIANKALAIINETQHLKESVIVNLSQNHNATFAQFFKIYLSVQSCASPTEVIAKLGDNKSSALFSQPYIIKCLQKLYEENQNAAPDLALVKLMHFSILNNHFNKIKEYPRLSRIISLLNPISLDDEGLKKLELAFDKNETTKKLFDLFSTAVYRSKYSNFNTLDTLLNYIEQKQDTRQFVSALAEEVRGLFPDLRFAGAKLDISEELITALDDLCGNLEDILHFEAIKSHVTENELSAIKDIIKKIKENTEPEHKIKFYGPLVNAILNLAVISSNPVQKALIVTTINQFMLPQVRAVLVEPLLSTVATLDLSENSAKTFNEHIERMVPTLSLNAMSSTVGEQFIQDLNRLSLAIKSINSVLQVLAFNTSMVTRSRRGMLVEQYLQHVDTSPIDTINVLITLCSRAKSVSVSSLFSKLTTFAIGLDEQKNKHVQDALTTLMTYLDQPMPSKVTESLITFVFTCAEHETTEIVAAITDLYSSQFKKNQIEGLEQSLRYALAFKQSLPEILQILTLLKSLDMVDAAKELLEKAKLEPSIILSALQLANQSKNPHAKIALGILLKSMGLESAEITKDALADTFDKLSILLENDTSSQKIQALYQKRPYFNFTLLNKNLSTMNEQAIQTACVSFDQDPTQKRDLINQRTMLSLSHQQFDILRVNSVSDFVYDIKKASAITPGHANTLKKAFYYVNDLGYRKIKAMNRDELLSNFKRLCDGIAGNANNKTKTLYRLELLAILREVMYRTTSTSFPYSTQIINVINDVIYHQGNVSSQIKTGEGKTIISTLKAAMMWCEPGHTVNVCTANLELAAQSRREFQCFYDYLDIPTAIIDKDSPDGTFRFFGINFSDVSNFRLYESSVKFTADSEWSAMMRNSVRPIIDLVLDENDVPILDEYRTAYNFSVQLSEQSASDINPNADLYPVINDFIETPEFKDAKATRKDDVEHCKQYFKNKKIPLNVNDAQIDIWLDSAVIASRLRENKDFVVVKTSVTVNKKEIRVSEAQIIINDRPQPGAKWTDGVHQFLHARLQQTNHKDADPFIIEPELSIVDTASSKTFIKEHLDTGGRLFGMTGTMGSQAEIKSYEDYELALYRMPSHKVNRLVMLPTLSASHEAGLYDRFFGKDFINQLKQQILDSKNKRDNQPILIFARNIEGVNNYHALLAEFLKENHINVQTVTGTQEATEEECIRKAGEPNMVTISTLMFGRGTNIKPLKKPDGSELHPHGLFTICTFLPDEREEEQIYGRSARDGHPGQYLRLYDPSNNYLVNLSGLDLKERESAIFQARLMREGQAQLKRLYAQATSECLQQFLVLFDQELLSIDINDSKKLHEVQTRRYLFINQIQNQAESLIDELHEDGINPFQPQLDEHQRHITTHLDLAQKQLRDFAQELFLELKSGTILTEDLSTASRTSSPKQISSLEECLSDIVVTDGIHLFVYALVAQYDEYRTLQIRTHLNDLAAAQHIERIYSFADDLNRISYEFELKKWSNAKLNTEIGTVIHLLISNTDKSYQHDLSIQFLKPLMETLIGLLEPKKMNVRHIERIWATLIDEQNRAKWLPYLNESTKLDFYNLAIFDIQNDYQQKFKDYIKANEKNPDKQSQVNIAQYFLDMLSRDLIDQIDYADESMPGYQPSSSSVILFSSGTSSGLNDPALREIIAYGKAFQADMRTSADTLQTVEKPKPSIF